MYLSKKVSVILFLPALIQHRPLQAQSINPDENRKPLNILFLFADDQRADALGAAGNKYISTPNIDKLALSGTRFTNTYVMGGHHGAISAPSRAMLMSGKYLFNVYDKLEGVTTMPLYFSKYGYETFGTGKWHNGQNTFVASFQKGRNIFFGGMADHYNIPCRDIGPDGKLTPEVYKKGFSTDHFTDAALDFITDYSKRKSDKPFFCYVAFTVPHDPRSPRNDFVGYYKDSSIPLPGNYMNSHPFAIDSDVRDEGTTPWPRTTDIIRASLADYYALVTHLDSKVGEIIESLKKNGLYENTIIIYAGDNGLAIGSHGLLGKQSLYEHSTKVPFIISGPGIKRGEESDALIYLLDIFPTLCSLCNLKIPENIDGKDFTSVIKGNSDGIRTSLFTAYKGVARAVRTAEWKLIRYPDKDFTQLFNLEKDPLEIINLAQQPAHKAKVVEMMSLLKEWQKITNDTAALTAKTILPLEYTYKQGVPDQWQPEYTIKKYYPEYKGKNN